MTPDQHLLEATAILVSVIERWWTRPLHAEMAEARDHILAAMSALTRMQRAMDDIAEDGRQKERATDARKRQSVIQTAGAVRDELARLVGEWRSAQ